MIGSITRRAECITPGMGLPAAIAGAVSTAETASTDITMVGRLQREMGNILNSPDVKPVKGRSFLMHGVRYLGALTRCKSWAFETCIKRAARQSGFPSRPRPRLADR